MLQTIQQKHHYQPNKVMSLNSDDSDLLCDLFNKDLENLRVSELLVNDLVKTVQRRPIVFRRFRKEINKTGLKEFNGEKDIIIRKFIKDTESDDVNYKQLSYLNSRIDSAIDTVKMKTEARRKHRDKDVRSSIAITDAVFQREIERIMNAPDREEEPVKGNHYPNSFSSILSGLEKAEGQEDFLEYDDNNFGEEIDLFNMYNDFCELTGTFTLSLAWFLEEFLVNKFTDVEYPLKNNELLEGLSKYKAKLWNGKAYLEFLEKLVVEIIKNISTYQPLLPIDFLVAKHVVPHYNKVIRKEGIVNNETGTVICQYCKKLFKDKEEFTTHKHGKITATKEKICLAEYKLHSLLKFIEQRLQKTILNLKIFSKLSANEKAKLPRFSSFELYPALERIHDRQQDKLEQSTVADLLESHGNANLLSESHDDVLHENRFIREQQDDADEEDEDNLPTWLVKLHKLDEKYQCEICGNINYKGRTNFESHFSDKRHVFGLQKLGYTGDDYDIFNGITKIKELKELLQAF